MIKRCGDIFFIAAMFAGLVPVIFVVAACLRFDAECKEKGGIPVEHSICLKKDALLS